MFKRILKVVDKVFYILMFSDPAVEQLVMPTDIERQCYVLVHQKASKDFE